MKTFAFIAIATIISFQFTIDWSVYAWHENLGIDSNKAAELYNSKPDDPAISQWKNALQLAINDADKCYQIETAIGCKELIATITSNCNSHPNELLACSDTRLAQYPSILKNAEENQKKIEEAKKLADIEKVKNLTIAYSSNLKETAASLIIDRCIKPTYDVQRFEITDPSCNDELGSLQKDCNAVYPVYNYCKEELFSEFMNQPNRSRATPGEQNCFGATHTLTDGTKICVVPEK